ncbi:hypothetical protein [Streptomyces scabiei]|uniref:hypothetical protein n=1 Tax=Streptomyces scabiei TaxID=1930 RepID=UPI0029B165B8|nr:hypothetical protein [Streptomyces scabiei]MDX3027512.1 hypothetical protein [Streptomyces scabiei]
MSAGKATNAYALRWQRDAHRALGEFLASAVELGLPAVSWTIATSGALVGDVDSLTSAPAEQRAAFETWVGCLGASVVPERVDSGGVSHLYAQFAWAKNADVRGAIRATVYPPFEDGGE